MRGPLRAARLRRHRLARRRQDPAAVLELRACAGLPYDLGALFMLDSMGTWYADDLALELHTYEPEAMAGEDALWPPTLEDYTLLT